MSDPQMPQLPEPQPPRQSTSAQKWTAALLTPVGILATLVLLPILGCCVFCAFSQFLGQRGH